MTTFLAASAAPGVTAAVTAVTAAGSGVTGTGAPRAPEVPGNSIAHLASAHDMSPMGESAGAGEGTAAGVAGAVAGAMGGGFGGVTQDRLLAEAQALSAAKIGRAAARAARGTPSSGNSSAAAAAAAAGTGPGAGDHAPGGGTLSNVSGSDAQTCTTAPASTHLPGTSEPDQAAAGDHTPQPSPGRRPAPLLPPMPSGAGSLPTSPLDAGTGEQHRAHSTATTAAAAAPADGTQSLEGDYPQGSSAGLAHAAGGHSTGAGAGSGHVTLRPHSERPAQGTAAPAAGARTRSPAVLSPDRTAVVPPDCTADAEIAGAGSSHVAADVVLGPTHRTSGSGARGAVTSASLRHRRGPGTAAAPGSNTVSSAAAPVADPAATAATATPDFGDVGSSSGGVPSQQVEYAAPAALQGVMQGLGQLMAAIQPASHPTTVAGTPSTTAAVLPPGAASLLPAAGAARAAADGVSTGGADAGTRAGGVGSTSGTAGAQDGQSHQASLGVQGEQGEAAGAAPDPARALEQLLAQVSALRGSLAQPHSS